MEIATASRKSVVVTPAPDETEQPIYIPKSYASKFIALRDVPIRAFVPVQKRNDAGRLQARVVIVTDGVVFLATPDGEIKRSFPLNVLEEVFCDPKHGLVVMIVPTLYDLAVFIDQPSSRQRGGSGGGSPQGTGGEDGDQGAEGGSSPSMPRRKSGLLGALPWNRTPKKGGQGSATNFNDIIPLPAGHVGGTGSSPAALAGSAGGPSRTTTRARAGSSGAMNEPSTPLSLIHI